MKKYCTRKKSTLLSRESLGFIYCLFIVLLQFNTFQLYAQKEKKEKNCETSCFQTEIIQVEQEGNCQIYELEVSHMGSCSFALSHFTVGVPCGTIANVTNSENWPIETDVLDPKTQLYGFKIDDIRDFGENDAPQKFRVRFEVCPTDEVCSQMLRCWEPVVAYKAGQCVHYDTISADCQTKTDPLTGTLSVQNPTSSGNSNGNIHLSVEGGAGPYTFIWSNGDTTQNLEGITEGYYSVTVVDSLGNELTLDTLVTVPETTENDSTSNDNDDSTQPDDEDTSDDNNEDSTNDNTDSAEGESDTGDEGASDGDSTEETGNETDGNNDSDNTDGTDSPDSNTDNDEGTDGNSGEDTAEGNDESVEGDTNSDSTDGNTDETDTPNDNTDNGSMDNSISCADCYSMKVITREKSGNCTYYEIEVATDGTCSTPASQSFSGTLTTQNPRCGGGNDGYIHLSVEGGTAPYSYSWSNGATTQNLESAGAGAYAVTIEDAAGSQLTLEATLEEPVPITLSHSVTPASCSGQADGSITLEVQGGNAPYIFNWADGITTQNRENISPGTYQVTVTDQTGCSTMSTISVSTASTISVSGLTTNASCGVGNDGAIDLNVYGGTAPYTFLWNNGETTEDIDNLSAGIYSVQITDANSCTAQKSFSIKTNTSLSVSANATRTGCTDDASGAIDLTVHGGTAPFTFSWSNGETTEDISGLTAGYYTVEVSDANGCGTSYSTYIRKEVLYFTYESISPSCPGEADGEIHIFPPDGQGSYTYTWGSGATTQSLTGLSSGYYYVTVTDTSGCSSSRYIAVEDPAPISIEYAISNQDCSENPTADLDIMVSGGTAPYTFTWSTGETSEDLAGISEGSYEVNITDANGCTISDTIEVSISCNADDGTGETDENTSEDNHENTGDDTSIGNSDGTTDGMGDKNNSTNNAEFIVDIPCGTVSNITNSGDWTVETHVVDTTTGLTGFKIDNIQDFAQSQQAESFTVGFTICADDAVCQEALDCWQPVVAYNSGQCIVYDTLQVTCDVSTLSEGTTLTTYPNPIEEIDQAVVEITLEEASFVTLEMYDLSGNLVTTLFEGEAAQGVHQFSLEGLTLNGDIYICKLITPNGIITQRLILPQ